MQHFEQYNYLKSSDACVKCGKCLPDCTIFGVNGDEATSPRGFIDLLGAYQRGEIPLDKNAKHIFEKCFLCTTCVSVCPNALPTDTMIENIRYELAQKYGIAWFKQFFFELLKNRKLMDLCFKIGAFFAPILFKSLPKEQSLTPRFKLPFIKNRVLGAIQTQSFLNSHPKEITNQKNSTQKVAIFIGCLSNYNYKEVGESLLKILKFLDINVVIPKKQKCCAAPAYFTGDFETTHKLICENVEYFESFIDEVDVILIPEATCAAMVIEDWKHFMQTNPHYLERIQKLLPKIAMATQWLYHNTNLQSKLANLPKINQTLTYHDPCHARKVLHIWQEPRALLAQNYQLIEMENPNMCCGFGGVTIQSEYFELAQKVGDKKAKMIKDTKADFVVAECNACRMQLTNALHQNKVPVTFAHPLELIAKNLENKNTN
ncbi:MAG: (Fe-S)-binding protein [Helicobacter sp.]|nr:(Fe-S)-binding protein [Helicobacter sp.]